MRSSLDKNSAVDFILRLGTAGRLEDIGYRNSNVLGYLASEA